MLGEDELVYIVASDSEECLGVTAITETQKQMYRPNSNSSFNSHCGSATGTVSQKMSGTVEDYHVALRLVTTSGVTEVVAMAEVSGTDFLYSSRGNYICKC